MKKMIVYILACIAFDQVLKSIALTSNEISGVFLSWRPCFNYGVTLSFFSHISPYVLALIQILALYLVCYLALPQSSTILVFSGAISNIIDRLAHGFVIDYLQFHFYHWRWPAVVNLADIYLVLGMVIFLWQNSLRKTSIPAGSELQSE